MRGTDIVLFDTNAPLSNVISTRRTGCRCTPIRTTSRSLPATGSPPCTCRHSRRTPPPATPARRWCRRHRRNSSRPAGEKLAAQRLGDRRGGAQPGAHRAALPRQRRVVAPRHRPLHHRPRHSRPSSRSASSTRPTRGSASSGCTRSALARVVDLGGAGPGVAGDGRGGLGRAADRCAVDPGRAPSPGPWMAAALLLSAGRRAAGGRARPGISLFGAAVVLYLVMRWRSGSTRVLLALPPLFALWANLHAGFIIGLGIAVVALLATRARRHRRPRLLLGAAIAAGAVATLVNPAGPGLWAYVAATFTDSDAHRAGHRVAVAELPRHLAAPVRGGGDPPGRRLGAGAAPRPLRPRPRRRRVRRVPAGAAQRLAVRAGRRAPAGGVRRGCVARASPPPAAGAAGRRRRRPPPRGSRSALWPWSSPARRRRRGAAADRSSAAQYEATHEPRAAADYAAAHLAGQRLYTHRHLGRVPRRPLPGGPGRLSLRRDRGLRRRRRCSSTSTSTTSDPTGRTVLAAPTRSPTPSSPRARQEVVGPAHPGVVRRLPRRRLGERGHEPAGAARPAAAGTAWPAVRAGSLPAPEARAPPAIPVTPPPGYSLPVLVSPAGSVGTLDFVNAAPHCSRARARSPRPR